MRQTVKRIMHKIKLKDRKMKKWRQQLDERRAREQAGVDLPRMPRDSRW